MKTSTRLPASNLDPSGLYESPRALALDGSLRRAERLSLLQRWEEDALDAELAASEGMTGPPSDLADIRRAIALLEEQQERAAPRRVADPRDARPAADEREAQPTRRPVDHTTPRSAVPYRLATLALLLALYAASLVALTIGGASATALGVATIGAALVALLILLRGARPTDGDEA